MTDRWISERQDTEAQVAPGVCTLEVSLDKAKVSQADPKQHSSHIESQTSYHHTPKHHI